MVSARGNVGVLLDIEVKGSANAGTQAKGRYT